MLTAKTQVDFFNLYEKFIRDSRISRRLQANGTKLLAGLGFFEKKQLFYRLKLIIS
jgi:hypothetical protein